MFCFWLGLLDVHAGIFRGLSKNHSRHLLFLLVNTILHTEMAVTDSGAAVVDHIGPLQLF